MPFILDDHDSKQGQQDCLPCSAPFRKQFTHNDGDFLEQKNRPRNYLRKAYYKVQIALWNNCILVNEHVVMYDM